MRVLSLLLSSGAGGLEAVAFQYARVLADAGCASALAVNRESPYAAGCGVEVFGVIGASLVNPLNHWAIASAVRRFRPEVVLGHGSRGADFCKSPLVRACAARGTRFIGVLHGENAKHFRGLDGIIAVSEKLREETIANYGFPPEHLVTVPNAVTIPAEESLVARPASDVPVIGFLGRFDPCKGLDILIAACASLKRRGVVFRLDIGGSGPQEGELRKLADELGLGDSVRWLGWVTDKREFFGNVDIFALPSREESFGLSMLEAMAHRRAVVLSDCPGPRAIVESAACGLVVPREETDALATALERVLRDEPLRLELAARGRELAEREYSENRLAERLMRYLI